MGTAERIFTSNTYAYEENWILSPSYLWFYALSGNLGAMVTIDIK